MSCATIQISRHKAFQSLQLTLYVSNLMRWAFQTINGLEHRTQTGPTLCFTLETSSVLHGPLQARSQRSPHLKGGTMRQNLFGSTTYATHYCGYSILVLCVNDPGPICLHMSWGFRHKDLNWDWYSDYISLLAFIPKLMFSPVLNLPWTLTHWVLLTAETI